MEATIAKQPNLWSVEDRLAAISAGGNWLEAPNALADFERFRPVLGRAAGPRAANGGRPALDAVPEFRAPALQSRYVPSFEATRKAVEDRLS